MKPRALKELHSIMKQEDEEERLMLLKRWEKDWVQVVSESQHVINKSTMSSDELDYAWYMAATRCGEVLIDEGISTNTMNNTELRCKVWTLRSSRAKL